MRTLLASDIYLLEQWHAFNDPSPIERRDRIFANYVALGNSGRWPYHVAAKAGRTATAAETSTILTPTRTEHEREVARILVDTSLPPKRPWLRTAYGGENTQPSYNDIEFEEITGLDNPQGKRLVLDDMTRYGYFTNWDKILSCLPEVVDSFYGPRSPDRQAARSQEAKNDWIQWIQEEADGLGNGECEEQLAEGMQQVFVTGCLWVQDESATATGNALLVWIDEFGRVVRQNRIGNVLEYNGMIDKGAFDETRWWDLAEIGDAYEGVAWLQ